MTYASGGLIQAADFSAISGTTTSTGASLLNTVWAVGTGDAGYGQTAVTPPSASDTVTANLGGGAGVSAGEWAGLINRLNNASTHQSGAATAVSPPTSGSTIAYIAALTGAVGTVYTNRLNFNTQGTTSTTSYSFSYSAASGATATGTSTRTCTFSSVDAARYFFNAGGQIKVNITSVTNVNGTSRSTNQVTTWVTNLGSKTMRARSSLARTGTGGTVTTDLTGSGFWNLTTSYVTFTKITTASATYTGDYAQIDIKTDGTVGSNAGNGSIVSILLTGFSALQSGFDDAVSVTVNYNIEVTYPETTYLANSWGTVTVA